MGLPALKRYYLDVALSFFLIGVGSFGLYVAHNQGMFESGARDSLFVSVGSLVDHTSGVRYRFSESMIWKEARASEEVSFGDAIFTAKDGRAKIHFKSGREATILPNSMVVIHEQMKSEVGESSSSPVIEIQKGKIALKRESGKSLQPILVKAGGKVYRIETAEAPTGQPPSQNTASAGDKVFLPSDDLVVSLALEVGHNDAPKKGSSSAPQAVLPALQIESSTPMKITEVASSTVSPSISLSGRTPAQSSPLITTDQQEAVSPPTVLTTSPSSDDKKSMVNSTDSPTSRDMEPYLAVHLSNPNVNSSKESPLPSPSEASLRDANELNLRMQVGYGATALSYSQAGDFGSLHGTVYTTSATSFQLHALYDDWKGDISFSHYSLDLPSGVASSSTQNQSLSDMRLEAGKGIFFLGVHAGSTPVAAASSGQVNWAAFSTVSPFIGLHFEKEAEGSSHRSYRLGLDLTGGYPLAVSGPFGASVSDSSGYEFEIQSHLRKALNHSPDPTIFFGVDLGASLSHMKCDATWDGVSGDLSRTLFQYQSLFVLELDL